MTKEEFEKRVSELAIQIADLYNEYNPNSKDYLNIIRRNKNENENL